MLTEPIIHYGPGAESSLNKQRILSNWAPSRIFRSIGGIIQLVLRNVFFGTDPTLKVMLNEVKKLLGSGLI